MDVVSVPKPVVLAFIRFMKSEKRSSQSPKRHFSGCVELFPPYATFVEFVTTDGIWGFSTRQLSHFVLENNPDHGNKKTLPPDQLLLFYHTAVVVLRGWRLELMLDPLIEGRIKRVHAEKHLGALILAEPWVSEIYVIESNKVSPMKSSLEPLVRAHQ